MNYKRLAWEGEPAYGKHLMVHLEGCGSALLEIDSVRKLITELVPAIDMQPFGPCHVHRFGEGVEAGISAFQLIYTSHISIHTNEAAREGYFDVFSCKPFEDETVLAALRQAFEPRHLDSRALYRV